jgi:hypothetical protein
MKFPKITMKAVVAQSDAYPSFSIEHYAVGLGFTGDKRSPVVRRYVRCRNANGVCSYFLWTHPDKGKLVPRVYGFRFRRATTRDKVIAHYKK